jgi:hypothetical protein
MNPNESLNFLFPVPEVFYPFPVQFLRIAASDMPGKGISRVLNSLQESQYITIADVVNSTMKELTQTRNFGKRGLLILLGLLEALSKKPELILDTHVLERPLRDEIERIKQVPPIKKQLLELGIKI